MFNKKKRKSINDGMIVRGIYFTPEQFEYLTRKARENRAPFTRFIAELVTKLCELKEE